MRKALFYTALFFFILQHARAQDSIQYRVILIGDGGEMNATQKAILPDAAQKNLAGKTVVIFLGDNIYPRGIELPGSKAAVTSENILRSEYEGFRKAGIPVYFVPGNHDWDESGPKGYDKMLRVNRFLREQNDSLLQMIPADACPGPYELKLSENLVIVAMDSEWWLYPFGEKTIATDCDCKTKRDVLGKLNDILERNRNKIILFATHHPFSSYGAHGGYFNLKDHIFPLTSLHKNLYVPLPVIGSLYPLLRKAFPPTEDLKSALYTDMRKSVDDVLKLHSNIIHVAGHEHTLQLISGDVMELVSGAGSKHTAVKKGSGSLFALSAGGYVIADILLNNDIRLTYRAQTTQGIENSYVYDKPHVNVVPVADQPGGTITGDSIAIKLNPAFDSVSKLHRDLFGENYRKVWAMEATLPVLRISDLHLVPEEIGGGFQTHSLRLKQDDKEWVLRSIKKFPDKLLPQALAHTLAADILVDNSSAAFPYAPLTVPVFSDALGVAHSNPKIVYIAPDTTLGIYSKDFANTVSIFEEREPLGKSLSTIKLIDKLKDDNDNAIDQQAFLRARLLDVFLGDWDRHGDQWRWIAGGSKKEKLYTPVPRDRDQVFYTNQGFFPKLAALPWISPKFQGFGGRIKNISGLCYNARLIDGIFTNDLSYDDWTKITEQTVLALTDAVIKTALEKLPASVYNATHQQLTDQLTKRKKDMLLKIPEYYRFLNKIIDIQASDKNELVTVRDTLNDHLAIDIRKLSKKNEPGKLLYSRLLDPSVTKEIRLFLQGGNDSVVIKNSGAPIRIRIVGDNTSPKKYDISGSDRYLRKVHLYEGASNAVVSGKKNSVHRHFSDDPANTALQLTNRYNNTIPLVNVGFNLDDGIIFGAGVKLIKQGFRKQPYASSQQFTFGHSFSTNAFRFIYRGEWLNALGKADFVLHANAFAPENTRNFFGAGNSTQIDKTGDYKRFYRARFSLFDLAPALRWRSGKRNSILLGPLLQYYNYSAGDNTGRFITDPSKIHSYDSATIRNDKMHAGVFLNFTRDSRNNALLPTSGHYINMRIAGYEGLNKFSGSFAQLITEMSAYRSIGRKSAVVIADRLGGGVTVGKAAFYQLMFLGGHENLWGYHQYRFAGAHMVYNNLEARIRLANVGSYILPGQLGIIGFYDIGKVWQKGYNSDIWHQGTGGGIYFAPAGLAVFQLVWGSSKEGLYPYFTMGFRF